MTRFTCSLIVKGIYLGRFKYTGTHTTYCAFWPQSICLCDLMYDSQNKGDYLRKQHYKLGTCNGHVSFLWLRLPLLGLGWSFFSCLFPGACEHSDAVMPLTTRTGEQVGGIALDSLPQLLLIFGPNGFWYTAVTGSALYRTPKIVP
jgi:hypothetical protein